MTNSCAVFLRLSGLPLPLYIARPPCRLTLETSQVSDGLKRLIRRLDALAIQLERTLGLDQGDQFLHWIDIARFQISLKDLSRAVFSGAAADRIAGCVRRLVQASAQQLQTLWVDEVKQFDVADVGASGRTRARDGDQAIGRDHDI